MNIIILGAGVVGTTQAYYLAKKGYKVTVFERHEGPALDTSYGNAGQFPQVMRHHGQHRAFIESNQMDVGRTCTIGD